MMPYPDPFPVPLVRLEETTSTNTSLKELCRKPVEELTTVVASYQTAGRGQRGNSWESDAGQNLLFSTVMYPSFLEVRQQFLLAQIASLAVKEMLDTFTGDITIKWPNDIYWREKKIAGMLIEHDLEGRYLQRSIVGIGININQLEFLSPAPNPVSLRQITGTEYSLPHLLGLVMQRLKDYYALLQEKETSLIVNHYHQALFRKTGLHAYRDANGVFEAEIVRVEPEGFLVLKDKPGNERKFMFKEVEYVLNLTTP